MLNDEMSREEAERWLAELTADPERMSIRMFQEGYEASLRRSALMRGRQVNEPSVHITSI